MGSSDLLSPEHIFLNRLVVDCDLDIVNCLEWARDGIGDLGSYDASWTQADLPVNKGSSVPDQLDEKAPFGQFWPQFLARGIQKWIQSSCVLVSQFPFDGGRSERVLERRLKFMLVIDMGADNISDSSGQAC